MGEVSDDKPTEPLDPGVLPENRPIAPTKFCPGGMPFNVHDYRQPGVDWAFLVTICTGCGGQAMYNQQTKSWNHWDGTPPIPVINKFEK